jgi:ABC-2 type transport system permease protein
VKSLLTVCRDELHRIFSLRPVFSVLIVATVLYSVLYPQPYVNEALRDVPIAVVDRDGTASSRELARRVDATSDAAVAMVLPDLTSAEREVYARNIYGILLIPKDFERHLLHGRPAPIALYADASYFLMYQRISGSVMAVARTFGTEVETARLIGVGVDPAIAGAIADPLPLTPIALFNPQGGYATYLLPAALVLILQQTLLIGTGLLGTLPGGASGSASSAGSSAGPVATILGKALAYLALEAIILPAYLVALPYLYGLPRLGSVVTTLFVAIPFVLSVSGLGLVIAAIFRTPLAVQLATAAIGLPFFFLAGFAWPSEAMPQAVRILSVLVPSTSAIDAFVRVGQLGAPLSDVRPQLLTLWGLVAFYGCIAVWLETARRPAFRSPEEPLRSPR